MADTRFKSEQGFFTTGNSELSNTTFQGDVYISGNLNIGQTLSYAVLQPGDLKPAAHNTYSIGVSGNTWLNARLGGTLYTVNIDSPTFIVNSSAVTANTLLTVGNSSVVALMPSFTGGSFGNTTLRWNITANSVVAVNVSTTNAIVTTANITTANIETLHVTSQISTANLTSSGNSSLANTTFTAAAIPSANGVGLGLATRRWNVFANSIDAATTLSAGNTTITGFANITSTATVSGSFNRGSVVGNASGTYTINCAATSIWVLTLTGNTTLEVSNAPVGVSSDLLIVVKQDSTGGRTLTFGTSWLGGTGNNQYLTWVDNSAYNTPTIWPDADRHTRLSLISDGSNPNKWTGFCEVGVNVPLNAGSLSGTIPSSVLGNSTLYIGNTAILLNQGINTVTTLGNTNITGNANTVTNGVYTSGSYSNPTWITSLSGSKISSIVANATHATTATSATSATDATNAANVYVTPTGTNAAHYLPFVTSVTAGNKSLVANTNLSFNPGTGVLTVTGNVAATGITGSGAGITGVNAAQLGGVSQSGYYFSNNQHLYANNTNGNSISGAADRVSQSITFNNSGAGAASGTTYIGNVAVTISYNTIGAAAAAHSHSYVSSVSGTSPIVSSGGLTPAISIPAANSSVNGHLTYTDWSTFNSKVSSGANITVLNNNANYANATNGFGINGSAGSVAWTNVSGRPTDLASFGNSPAYANSTNGAGINGYAGGASTVTVTGDGANATRYLLWADASGSSKSIYANTNLTHNPATGVFTVTGSIRSTGDITAFYSSDIALKRNITAISSPLSKISSIGGYEFDWSDEYIEKQGGVDSFFVRKHDVGVIAQEIARVLPEAVAMRADGVMGVKYERIVPLLIEGIKSLTEQVEDLRKKLDGSKN